MYAEKTTLRRVEDMSVPLVERMLCQEQREQLVPDLKLQCLQCTVKGKKIDQQVEVHLSNHRVLVTGRTFKEGQISLVKEEEKKESAAPLFAKIISMVTVSIVSACIYPVYVLP